jgi:hypothetical protein
MNVRDALRQLRRMGDIDPGGDLFHPCDFAVDYHPEDDFSPSDFDFGNGNDGDPDDDPHIDDDDPDERSDGGCGQCSNGSCPYSDPYYKA